MNWSELTTQGRIDAIRSVWQPGMSAAQIASHFDGVSRNAVIGMFHRHADKMADMRLGAIGDNGQNHPKRKGKSTNNLAWRMQRKAKLRVVKPVPAIEHVTFAAVQTAGIPLMMLESHRCKWPVNDGSPFLFCGEAKTADVPFCPFHSTLAYRPVGRVDERGTDQKQAA